MTAAFPLDLNVSNTPQVPFARLVAVEWRKLSDTRAGRWLLGITAAILVLILGIIVLVAVFDDNFGVIGSNDFFGVMLMPCQLLLPILAVVTVTTEWGQRTALTTFALEPRRGRVIAAKTVAVTLLAVAVIALSLIIALIGTVVVNNIAGVDPSWDLTVKSFLWSALPVLLWFLCAFGLGMLLMSTPFAIIVVYVASLLLPYMVFGALLSLFTWASNVVPFFDMTFAWGQIQTGTVVALNEQSSNGFGTEPIGTLQYVQAVSATLLWVVLPIVLGYLRITKSEVK